MAAKKTTIKKLRPGQTAPKYVLMNIKVSKRKPIAFAVWSKLFFDAINDVEDVYPDRCQVPIYHAGKRLGEITVT
jgi:hypothetical protein